jgi:hypothetical protein
MEKIPFCVTFKDLVGSAPHRGFIDGLLAEGSSLPELRSATRLLLTKSSKVNMYNRAALQPPSIIPTPSFKFFVGVFTFLTAENTNHGR